MTDHLVAGKQDGLVAYDVRFLAVWPCMLYVEPIEVTYKCENERWDTKINFRSDRVINLSADISRLGVWECRDSALIDVRSKVLFRGTPEEIYAYYALNLANSQKLISKYVSLTNGFITNLKRHFSDVPGHLIRLRSVGLLDFTLHTLIIDNRGVYFRTNQLFGNLGLLPKEKVDTTYFTMEGMVKREWTLLTRSADLINIGYADEGLIVAFALLDYQVQNFVRRNLDFLTTEEIDAVLRGIERNRLQTFLGPLMKILKGKSMMENTVMKSDLKWLNNKRNEIMHNGASCTSEEAQRALKIVIRILGKLNDIGADLDLPSLEILF